MKKSYQITETGKADLEAELSELKGRRGEIAEKIATARDFGDLSENAEYDAAREEQGLVVFVVVGLLFGASDGEGLRMKRLGHSVFSK